MDRTAPAPDGSRLTRQVLQVILSGLMVPLCFPPYGWRPFALVAWLPLVHVATRTTARRAFYLGLLQGLLAYGTSARPSASTPTARR